MEKIYEYPKALRNEKFSFCPGCTHGLARKMVAECIGELGIEDVTVEVGGIGCSYMGYSDTDQIGCAHGRAPAVATGIKACVPEAVVLTYQGDGDCSSIGAAEIIHVAGRGEKLTTFMINNGVFAMTGGQKAPTTLFGQKTTTTQDGRQGERDGYPLREAELIANVPGAYYVARASLHDVPNMKKAKEYMKKALQNQMDGKGFNFVELLSACPTNWGLSPVDSLARIKNEMVPYFPLGEMVIDGERV